jgi:hypothetical protein
MTHRRPIRVWQGEGALTGNPPSYLLVAWESYMTPSCMATHFFIAIQVRVKEELTRDGLLPLFIVPKSQ